MGPTMGPAPMRQRERRGRRIPRSLCLGAVLLLVLLAAGGAVVNNFWRSTARRAARRRAAQPIRPTASQRLWVTPASSYTNSPYRRREGPQVSASIVRTQRPPRPPPPPPSPAPPPPPTGPPTFPDGVPKTICLAWRGTSSTDCSPYGERAPHLDRECSHEVSGDVSGYCEVLDIMGMPDGSIQTLGVRQVMHKHCKSRPDRFTCSEATGFANFVVDSDPTEAGRLSSRPTAALGPSSGVPNSRGIVMSVHDSQMYSAYASIRLLRDHGCDLPVELWSFPGEVSKQAALVRDLVENHGCTERTIAVAADKICSRAGHCFAVKAYSIYHSSFESVLLMDADNFAARDPSYLFDSAEFASTGAIFWPDYWHPADTIFGVDSHNMLWELLGLDFVDSFEQESGQVLLDRRRHMKALDIMMQLMSPDNPIWTWNLVWGDKDIFRLSMIKAGRPFHFIEQPPGSVGPLVDGFFCGLTMLQFDPAGRPLFLHRNTYKIGKKENMREVWDAYTVYTGSNYTAEFRTSNWDSRGSPARFWLKSECFGLSPKEEAYRTNPNWKIVSMGAEEALKALEKKILRLAQEGFEKVEGGIAPLRKRLTAEAVAHKWHDREESEERSSRRSRKRRDSHIEDNGSWWHFST